MTEDTGNMASGGERVSPTRPSERLEILDVLRGFAILGILSANLQIFISPEILGIASPNGGASAGTFQSVYSFLVTFLSEGKFITALAFLLGLGLAMQAQRSRSAGHGPARFLFRRLLVLGGIGVLHALLVWSGDVLLFYALLGLPFLLFVNRPPATLLKWAAGILGLILVCGLLIAGIMALSAAPGGGSSETPASFPNFITEPVRSAHGLDGGDGSYAGQVGARAAKLSLFLPASIISSGPMVFSMMLLGAAAANSGEVRRLAGPRRLRSGVREVEAEDASRTTLGRLALVCLGIGLPVNLVCAIATHPTSLLSPSGGYDMVVTFLAGTMWMVGAPVMALGWMSLLAWLLVRSVRSGADGHLSSRLAAVGRMALTNYLAQSLIMCGIIYSFGIYGEISYSWAALLMVGIWSLELIWSKPYLERFSFGPLEWVWRRLSYPSRKP